MEIPVKIPRENFYSKFGIVETIVAVCYLLKLTPFQFYNFWSGVSGS
jgi:hypothetical protein